MTFDLLERSRWLARPIFAVRIARGALVERYVAADRAQVISGETYEPLSIERGELNDTAERLKAVLQLTLPITAGCVPWWRPYPPSQTVGVTCLAKHIGDADVAVEWIGRVIGHRFTDTQLHLSCEPTKTNARSRGLVLRWQRGCPLALYSQGIGMCNVDKALHAVPGTVGSLVGTALTVAAFAAAPKSLAGGFVEWTRADGEPELRSIMAHAGSLVLLNYGSDALPPGTAVTAYPGCPHNWSGCESFDNTDNYGGSRYMPGRTPFDGNPL